jgi:hypothetical protein
MTVLMVLPPLLLLLLLLVVLLVLLVQMLMLLQANHVYCCRCSGSCMPARAAAAADHVIKSNPATSQQTAQQPHSQHHPHQQLHLTIQRPAAHRTCIC